MTKTLFITGASSGIGAATARAAAKCGWKVALFARSEDKLKKLAEEIGTEALVLPGDATDYEAQKAAIERVVEEWGQLDAVFANAGRGTSQAGTEKGDPEDWKGMVEINIMGALHTAHAALPHLRASGAEGRSPAILNISSSVTQIAVPNYAVYAAAKAGLNTLTQCLALELAADRIRVNAICPGVVRTPIFETMMSKDEAAGFLDGFGAAVPLGRVGEPGDIARMALPLLSPQNDWITGAIVTVDGGSSLGVMP